MTYFQKNSLVFLFFTTLTIAQDSENQVYGFITDSTSGEALIGANVFIRETGQGMATDNNGYYVLSEIELDEATLIVSYVGYKQYQRKIDFKDNSSQNLLIALKPDVIELLQVDVSLSLIHI